LACVAKKNRIRQPLVAETGLTVFAGGALDDPLGV